MSTLVSEIIDEYCRELITKAEKEYGEYLNMMGADGAVAGDYRFLINWLKENA